jgi:type IV secretion system protein VirB10
MISFALAGVLAIGVLLSSVVSLLTTSEPKAQPGEVQQPTGKPVVKQFGADVDSAAAAIAKNVQAASQVTEMARELHAELPPCDEQMRKQLKGGYYLLRSRNPELPDANLTCGTDNQWVLLPPAVGQLRNDTAAQAEAEAHASPSGGLSAAEKHRQRMAAIYQSSPIPLHFADASAQTDPANQPGQAIATNIPVAAAPVQAVAVSQPVTQTVTQTAHQPLGVELSSYTGPRYPLFQGRIIEGLLVNRLKGDQGGPVKVQVTTPVYSQDSQHVLIKPGDTILGEAVRVNAAGEQRIAVVFHRIIMQDGWSFLLDPTNALDQQGAAGLTGKVDRHLVALVATAVMVGAIEGLSDFTNIGGNASATVEIQSGMSRESGNEAMQILRNAMNRPNGITVYEGSRVKIWVAQDQRLPAYEGHVVSETVK